MYPSGLLQLSSHRAAGKPERLLRAAITAFCSIRRPTRRETAQLDDLAVPLLGSVSDDTLRFVAAALSESPFAPPVLVRRLSDQPVEISAPLLMRSPVLSPIDLVALIGRHGLAHARAIAARPDLDERIMRLIRSIGALGEEPAPAAVPDRAEAVRERLRAMMRPAGTAEATPQARLRREGDPGPYRKLRSTALSGAPALFHTALADALGVAFSRARAIAAGPDVSELIVALRALSLSEEEALLILHCVQPGRTGDVRAIRALLEAYQAVSPEGARRIADEWRRGEAPAEALYGPAANAPSPAVVLKAS